MLGPRRALTLWKLVWTFTWILSSVYLLIWDILLLANIVAEYVKHLIFCLYCYCYDTPNIITQLSHEILFFDVLSILVFVSDSHNKRLILKNLLLCFILCFVLFGIVMITAKIVQHKCINTKDTTHWHCLPHWYGIYLVCNTV